MFWKLTEHTSRKAMIADILSPIQNRVDNSTVDKTVLKHCLRGCNLWAVWQQIAVVNGDATVTSWISLYVVQRRTEGWSYRQYTEAKGIEALTCPVGYFQLVPAPNVAAERWREAVIDRYDTTTARSRKSRIQAGMPRYKRKPMHKYWVLWSWQMNMSAEPLESFACCTTQAISKAVLFDAAILSDSGEAVIYHVFDKGHGHCFSGTYEEAIALEQEKGERK